MSEQVIKDNIPTPENSEIDSIQEEASAWNEAYCLMHEFREKEYEDEKYLFETLESEVSMIFLEMSYAVNLFQNLPIPSIVKEDSKIDETTATVLVVAAYCAKTIENFQKTIAHKQESEKSMGKKFYRLFELEKIWNGGNFDWVFESKARSFIQTYLAQSKILDEMITSYNRHVSNFRGNVAS
jgi:hypothetical protein